MRASLILLTLICTFAIAQNDKSLFVKPEATGYDEKVFDQSKVYVIFNHPSSSWDEDKSSKEGIQKLLNIVKSSPEKFETLVVVDPTVYESQDKAEKYYIKSSDVDHTIRSASGAHEMTFPNARALVFAGGNLSICLCESIRDSIRNSKESSEPLDVILVSDAIFDYKAIFDGYMKNFVIDTSHENLKNFLDLLNLERTKDYFQDKVFGKTKMCPEQDWSLQGPVDPKSFTFVLKNNGKTISTFGNGKKIINVHLTSTDDLNYEVNGVYQSQAINDSDRSQTKDNDQIRLLGEQNSSSASKQ